MSFAALSVGDVRRVDLGNRRSLHDFGRHSCHVGKRIQGWVSVGLVQPGRQHEKVDVCGAEAFSEQPAAIADRIIYNLSLIHI